jgi:hypothetical protein
VAAGRKGEVVPLSEDEQRILQEMEQTLYQHDPKFAYRVRNKTVYRHAGRHLWLAGLVILLGLVVMVAFFTVSVFIGFLGFLIMLAGALICERNLRRVGRAGWQDLTRSPRAQSLAETLSDTRRRLRERFRRPD